MEDVINKIRFALLGRPKKINSSSIFRGVSKTKNGWDSRIKYKGELYLLGCFKLEIDAANAYNNFVIDNNFPHPLNEIGA